MLRLIALPFGALRGRECSATFGLRDFSSRAHVLLGVALEQLLTLD
jgi:hypothetical protein